jgi:hypothetical protein
MKGWRIFLRVLGAGDVVTGGVLMCRPQWVFAALHATVAPDADVFVRWIGVFVTMVGAATSLRCAGGVEAWRTNNRWSALTRFAVAAFVAVSVLTGRLPLGFAVVGAWDGIAALLQQVADGRLAGDVDA